MSTMTKIREQAVVVPAAAFATADLARRASDALGYSRLEAARERVAAQAQVAGKLTAAGILVLNPGDVARHKSKLSRWNWPAFITLVALAVIAIAGGISISVLTGYGRFAVGGVVACPALGGAALFVFLRRMTWHRYSLGRPSAARAHDRARTMGVVVAGTTAERIALGRMEEAALADAPAYDREVPAWVLERALEVRAALGEGCVFFVEAPVNAWELAEVERRERARIESLRRDPFLVVSMHGVEHYIAVWDEPTWNGKSMVAGHE